MRHRLIAASLFASLWLAPAPGFAQAGSGCRIEQSGARQVVRCPGGLRIVSESRSGFSLIDRNGDGGPDAVGVRSGAVLVDLPKGARPGGFEVVTPQAIAAVRGTVWAVDVSGATTSVFVVSGRVAVRSRSASEAVTLGAGEGVDVRRGGALEVRRWGAARVSALMARLGQ